MNLQITKTNCLAPRDPNSMQYRTWIQIKWLSMYFARLASVELLSHEYVKWQPMILGQHSLRSILHSLGTKHRKKFLNCIV